jgi:hypothetical protein
VVVNSKTVNTTRGLNPGYSINDIWAEQTYVVTWNGNSHIGMTKFGGRNVDVSDDVTSGIFEHYAVVNASNYNGESIDFGFSFDVVVNTKDTDDDTSNRFAQGTLRQFVLNANAIKGADRCYFVNISGEIVVNSTLGDLIITDENTTINGTVFNTNMVEIFSGVTLNASYVKHGFNVSAENTTITRMRIVKAKESGIHVSSSNV